MSARILPSLCCLVGLLLAPATPAQQYTGPTGPPLTADELDALVTPIALQPDLLVDQILEASKDPKALVAAGDLLNKPGGDLKAPTAWPGAIKVLLHVPTVLEMMDKSLSWTTRLGNAVVTAEYPAMNAAIQRVRKAAYDAGNLTSNDKLKVVEQDGTLKIELADPAVLYAPDYDPAQVLEKHTPSCPPWMDYGSPITIPGFKDVAAGLKAVEYVHTAKKAEHSYYARPTTERVEVRTRRVVAWGGYGYDHDHDHHHHD